MLNPGGYVDSSKVSVDIISACRLPKELQSLFCDGFGCRETDQYSRNDTSLQSIPLEKHKDVSGKRASKLA